jgi:hypothetical protein
MHHGHVFRCAAHRPTTSRDLEFSGPDIVYRDELIHRHRQWLTTHDDPRHGIISRAPDASGSIALHKGGCRDLTPDGIHTRIRVGAALATDGLALGTPSPVINFAKRPR